MKKLILILSLILSLIKINAQDFEWARSTGGSGSDFGLGITTDSFGNIYNTGYFSGTVDFDPNSGTTNLSSSGGRDIYIQKLDPSGNFIWAKSIGGTGNDAGNGISIDSDGNIYLIGDFASTVDFDPGIDSHNLSSNGSGDYFILKLDINGDFLWINTFGGVGYDYPVSIKIDNFNNIYMTSIFSGTVDFDPTSTINNISSNGGSQDFAIQKFNSSGNVIWTKIIGGPSADYSESLSLDNSGNIYITGTFSLQVDFNSGSGVNNLLSNGALDIFILKIDSSGNYLWANSTGSNVLDRSLSVTNDQLHNVYITGFFQNTVDFDPGTGISSLTSNGGTDVFIQKFDSSGNFVWANSFGGAGDDWSTSIAVDNSDFVYVAGEFEQTVDFNPGNGIHNISSNGGSDIFAQKLDNNGTFVWAKQIGSFGNDQSRGLTVDVTGNIYLTGSYRLSVEFDPIGSTSTLSSNGQDDIYILKLSDQLVDVKTSKKSNKTNLFPNPTTGSLSITLNEVSTGSLRVLNSLGQVAWKMNLKLLENLILA